MMFRLTLVLLSLLVFTGCTSVMTAEQAAPNFANQLPSQLNLVVLDHRPYVRSGDKAPSFEGLSRSGFGIPYSQYTYNRMPLADYLAARIVAGAKKDGVDLHVIKAVHNDELEDLKPLILEQDQATLVLELINWKYDFHPFNKDFIYNVNISILDKTGNPVVRESFDGDEPLSVGFDEALVNAAQKHYQKKLRELFLNKKIQQALNSLKSSA